MIFIFEGSQTNEFCDLDAVDCAWYCRNPEYTDPITHWGIKYTTKSGKNSTVWFTSREARDASYQKFMEAKSNFQPQKEKKNMLSDIRKYISDNRDAIYTIAFVAVLDQLLFEGAFRERLKTMVEGFLKKVENKAA